MIRLLLSADPNNVCPRHEEVTTHTVLIQFVRSNGTHGQTETDRPLDHGACPCGNQTEKCPHTFGPLL